MILVFLCFFGYLFGSIPFGVMIGKMRGVDLRKAGSGNIGAANAFRQLGFAGGFLVLAGDLLKGALALWAAKHALPLDSPAWYFILIGLAAILGHNYSCFLRFSGGKGVATTAGVFIFISWKAALLSFSSWIVVVMITRYASLASLTASALIPVTLKLFGESFSYVLFGWAAFLLTVFKHKENVKRLLAGNENKFVIRSKPR